MRQPGDEEREGGEGGEGGEASDTDCFSHSVGLISSSFRLCSFADGLAGASTPPGGTPLWRGGKG